MYYVLQRQNIQFIMSIISRELLLEKNMYALSENISALNKATRRGSGSSRSLKTRLARPMIERCSVTPAAK